MGLITDVESAEVRRGKTEGKWGYVTRRWAHLENNEVFIR